MTKNVSINICGNTRGYVLDVSATTIMYTERKDSAKTWLLEIDKDIKTYELNDIVEVVDTVLNTENMAFIELRMDISDEEPVLIIRCTDSGISTSINSVLESSYDATYPEHIHETSKKILNSIKEDLASKILSRKMSGIDNLLSEISGVADTDSLSKTSLTSADNVDEIIQYINSKTKATVTKPNTTLKDYMCTASLMIELNEIKEFMENFNTYKDLGIDIPNGILFKGEPGTGKTYAAKCIAGDTDCYFLSCTASSLQGQYIGSGTQNIKTIFDAARKLREVSNKGVIVFIDELDSLGSREHSRGDSGESDRTLNQLLAEMDGFESLNKIIIMGATNYISRIDDALLRSGRFSRQITIPLPEYADRINLINFYFNHKLKIKLNESINNYQIADITESLSPADIKEIANESAILAVRNKDSDIKIDYINEAINKVITKNIRNEDKPYIDTHLVSAHESGHVLAEILLFNTYPIKVTSYSYGNAGGFTQSAYKLGLKTKDSYINEVKVLLGGRAAEEVIENKITNGASNDLEKAKNMLKNYYKTYVFESYDVDKLNQLIIDDIFKYYKELVTEFKAHKEELSMLTEALNTKRILYRDDLKTMLPDYIISKTTGEIIL